MSTQATNKCNRKHAAAAAAIGERKKEYLGQFGVGGLGSGLHQRFKASFLVKFTYQKINEKS